MYSPAYEYETGFAYEAGTLQPLRMQGTMSLPVNAPPGSCYDFYLVGYDNTGTQVVNTYLGEMCAGGIPNSGGSWGGSGSSTSGGGGGGYTSVSVPTEGPKVNPKQEVKCFTSSQPATITIYVNQPVPGTSALNGGTVGVGHTFVGIEQNGITRYIGYYARTGANSALLGLGVSYPGEVHDNSGSLYNVSISTTVTGAQLASIVNYISNSIPATYTLNNYNCADFGITIGNLAGMNLPATTTSAYFGRFNGRSPGQLGQDIANMNPQGGVNVSTARSSAPTKQGGC